MSVREKPFPLEEVTLVDLSQNMFTGLASRSMLSPHAWAQHHSRSNILAPSLPSTEMQGDVLSPYPSLPPFWVTVTLAIR